MMIGASNPPHCSGVDARTRCSTRPARRHRLDALGADAGDPSRGRRHRGAGAAFFAGISKREFLIEAHKREMLGYPVSNVVDIATDLQLGARCFFETIDGERYCGSFAMIDGERPSLKRPADPAGRAMRRAGQRP